MKFTLVAGDHAQSLVLQMLETQLKEAGHETCSFFCDGQIDKFPKDVIDTSMRDTDWLIAGMSNNSSEEVAAVEEARERGVKIALYADTYGAHSLKAFESVRNYEVTLFVINDHEAMGARETFPFATIVTTGNPRWEEFAFPKLSRSEARLKLEIPADRRVILSAGDKHLDQNNIQFEATIKAVEKLGWESGTEILLALHPGDLNDRAAYEKLATEARCPTRVIGRHTGINSTEIIIGCDLVVGFTTTLSITAACLRIPTIDFCSQVAMGGKEPKIGVDPWELAAQGATIPVYYGSVQMLVERMKQIEETSVGRYLLEAQKLMFPVPSPESRGQAIALMCKALGA